MSTILTLLCHGATSATRGASFPADEPLDASGHERAAARAARLRRVDAAFTSPALRAMQTAAAMGLGATIEPALADIDYGAWSGRSLDEVGADDPDGAAAWLSDCAAAPHGGESILALLARVAAWMPTIANWDGRVVAVTHAAIARAAIILALDANPASFWRIDVPPLCIVRLRGNAAGWTLLSVGPDSGE